MKFRASYRLRTLFALVTLTAILLCWLAVQLNHGRKQRAAALAITEMGGTVGYDFQMSSHFPFGGYVDDKAASRIPGVIRSLLGEDVFHRVVYVLLRGQNDDDLKHLAELPHLRQLHIVGDAVTDEGIRHLHGLTNLKDLSLNVPMTDESLEHLSSLKSLKTLFLMGDSKTFRRTSKATQLFDYGDYNSEVTKEGVENLAKKLPECRITY